MANEVGTGAMTGAQLGTALGGAFGPIGAAVGAGVGLAGGAIGGAIAQKRRKKILENLGLSEAEKDQMAQAAQRSAAQQVGAQQRAVARQTMAAGGTPLAGRGAELTRQLTSAGAEAGAQARMQAENLAQQIEQARRAEYQRQLEGNRAYTAQAAQVIAPQVAGAMPTMLDRAGVVQPSPQTSMAQHTAGMTLGEGSILGVM